MIRLLLALTFAAIFVAGASSAAAQTAPPLAGYACADFDSWIWAQTVHDANPGGNPALDPDGDGIACPELPDGFAPAAWTTGLPAGAEPARLLRVIDGDTIEAEVGGRVERVRLILIDTPETKHPSKPVQCFGAEASAFTTALLTNFGGQLYLERDVSERDRYDRLLRYAWLDLGDSWRQGGQPVAPAIYNVNEIIARGGYADISTFPPDVTYVDEIRAAVTFARDYQLGLWSSCDGFGVPLTAPVPAAAPAPAPVLPVPAAPAPAASGNCDPSYPTLCIPPGAPDLDCKDISARRFPVLPPDPHRFDGDHDGVGCESG
ncbi:MAG: thermonuclease family protein [Thermomicrobiales bacterium]|nr:thermonuclease family protein [Thermomicrobiales bacterium]